MATLVNAFDQSDTTDANGQVYCAFPAHIDFVLGQLSSPHSGRHVSACWVSGDKEATVRIENANGSPYANASVGVTVAAWHG